MHTPVVRNFSLKPKILQIEKRVLSKCVYSLGPISLHFNGQPQQNNSIINSVAIDNGAGSQLADALMCLTSQFPCCDSDDGGWYSSTGSPLRTAAILGSFYQRYFTRQFVILYRASLTPASAEGLFHCQLPDAANITQYVYIGIYGSESGKGLW